VFNGSYHPVQHPYLRSLDFIVLQPETINALQDEWHHIFLSGPGVLVLKPLFPDSHLLGRINCVFSTIISSEAAATNGSS
jgi:hypothetical protein